MLFVQAAAAKETWTKVTTKNFTLIGNASEKEIRGVATRLEQFREGFSRIFNRARMNTFVPTTVIVFKDYDSYKPFNPGANSGYFQAGQDVNYITLAVRQPYGVINDPFETIYHEYTHLLIKNNMTGVPAWFNEGLAEYYSKFEVQKDGMEVLLGKPIGYHVLRLREEKFLPLATLLAVDHDSPYYNERSKRNVFYAESWALVHYLIANENKGRQAEFTRFLQLLRTGVPSQTAFRTAFSTDFDLVEKELKAYVMRDSYVGRIIPLGERLSSDASTQSAPVTDAEAQGYLADLLLHTNRLTEAETYVQKALALDPKLPMAHATLGMLRFRQRRIADAQKELEIAVADDSRNYLAHYYYAFALTREHAGENMNGGFAPETAARIRTHLKRVMELAPEYAEAYDLNAYLSLVSGDLDEATAMIQKAMALAPDRRENFSMTLAQILMRRNDYKAARALLEPIAQQSSEDHLRRGASDLLDRVKQFEDYEAKRREFEARNDEPASPSTDGPPTLKHRGETKTGAGASDDTDRVEVQTSQPSLATLRPRAEGEEQSVGMLVGIECSATGAILHVRVGERLLKLNAGKLDHVVFVSYSKEQGAGEIGCGTRNPPGHVLVTYRPTTNAADKPSTGKRDAGKNVKTDGDVVAVDFIPAEWK
ncbi:MAG: tetratricopeptide repeat protein [Pyrinomonadaceae bacterium]